MTRAAPDLGGQLREFLFYCWVWVFCLRCAIWPDLRRSGTRECVLISPVVVGRHRAVPVVVVIVAHRAGNVGIARMPVRGSHCTDT